MQRIERKKPITEEFFIPFSELEKDAPVAVFQHTDVPLIGSAHPYYTELICTRQGVERRHCVNGYFLTVLWEHKTTHEALSAQLRLNKESKK